MTEAAARATRYRGKAEELRTVADQMKNPMARESFRRMAQTYDHLADHLERGERPGEAEQPEAG